MHFDAYLASPRLGSKHLAAAVALILALSVVASLPVSAVTSTAQQQEEPGSEFKLVGPAPSTMPVLVTFAIPLRNVGFLDTLVSQISDPTSPMYRHFLTKSEISADFLPTAQFDSLSRYLSEAGFTIESTALDSIIVAEGTPALLQTAFNDNVDVYTNGTYAYYANTAGQTFDGAYVYASNATFLYTHPLYTGLSQQGNVTFTTGSISLTQLQQVYNASSLYAQGYTGSGETLGILDFYGSPTISSDLQQFDSTFGLPSTTLTVTPVGPYDPNLGNAFGWSPEVSLDVEASHSMAPSAAIDLFVANGALPLAAPLATIVQADNVSTLSQSFGNPEWYYSLTYYLGGPSWFALNALIPDQLYALGSAEGITFLASSGDGGGRGYSSGPEGGLLYPSSSPYVTSVGGTQTYISEGSNGEQTSVQTAWSSVGYVGSGAGGGGVSILEPKPWYQDEQSVPSSYPDGRMDPDLSLQAGENPGVVIVLDGQDVGIAGTSVATPLMSGLVALIAQSSGGSLGLINPFLYQMGDNATLDSEAYHPITIGYTTPWTASAGYNMATGWGAPNAGEMSTILNSLVTVPQLSIVGEILNASQLAQIDFTPGTSVSVQLQISYGGYDVATGSFHMSLQSLEGSTTDAPLAYDSSTGNWTGSVKVGQLSGITDVTVSGSSGGIEGEAFGTIFAGYLATILPTDYYYSFTADPWSWSATAPLSISVVSTDLAGNPAPSQTLTLSVETYSLADNSYSNASATQLAPSGAGVFQGNLSAPVSAGPISVVLSGDTYSYAPAVFGMWLQTSYIYPEVAAEPGSIAPGQSVTVIASPIAPVNAYFNEAYETGTILGEAVQVGANVTASLVTPSGTTVSSSSLYYQSCAQALRVCDGGADVLYGQLAVPQGVAPGLYTVMLNSSYGSYTAGGNMTGRFYGQLLVSSGATTPIVTFASSTLYEGEHTTMVANITYPNGTEVRFGEYTAVVYPEEQQGNYTYIMHKEYQESELVALQYDPALDMWVGNLTLPSPSNSGALFELGGNELYYSGPYEAYVTGLSYDGVPTTTALSAEQPFYIQPYVEASGPFAPAGQTTGLAFDNALIRVPTTLSGDLFVGNNTILGANVSISSSQNQGTITIVDSNVTLDGFSGGSIKALDSHLTVYGSSLGGLELNSSTISLNSSTYMSVEPSAPSVTIDSPAEGKVFNGTSFNVTIAGQDVKSVKVYLDGGLFASSGPLAGENYTFPASPTSIPDGEHVLTVVVQQSDGISSTASASFGTDARLVALQNSVNQLGLDIIFVVALGIVALIAAVLSMRRRPGY